MTNKARWTVLGVVVLVITINLTIAGATRVLSSGQGSELGSMTIPYTGRLSDETGQPVADGAYDFAFALYDAAKGGDPLWSERQEGVMLEEGTFFASLGSVNPISGEVLDSGAHWLAVGVRGPEESDFAALTPRQRLRVATPTVLTRMAAPAAGHPCPHDHFGETWEGSASYGLWVENTAPDGWGVYGATSSANGAGVVAYNEVVSGTALSIAQGAIEVKGAGLDTDTPVFKHEVRTTGAGANICSAYGQYYSTVVDHPLINGNPDAILIVTPNYGLASSFHVGPAKGPYAVYYDDHNQCGFGDDKWVIYNNDSTTLNDGQVFNVLVVVP